VEALQEALERYGQPEIFNTDQGCQFTDVDFTRVLKDHAIHISMDGKADGVTTCSSNDCGSPSSTKKCICEPMTPSPWHARASLATFASTTPFGNTALDRRTPDDVYFESLPLAQAA